MTVEQGGRLQRLIDELLLVAAAEHSNVQMHNEEIGIADLFASIGADTVASTGGRLESSGDITRTVVSDRSKIERVLCNLVENAAKYAPAGPIELHAACAGDDLRLSVVDHGPGIPARERERVFERFVQLDQSSTRRQGGTGLGLHLCRQLAELVDGHMTLEETPGGGCTFTLTIPAAAEPAAVVTRPAPGTEATQTATPFANVRCRPAELGRAHQEPAR